MLSNYYNDMCIPRPIINYDMCILIINDMHIYLVNCLAFLLVSYVPGRGGGVKAVKKATWLKITGRVLIELTHDSINALTIKNSAPSYYPPPPPPRSTSITLEPPNGLKLEDGGY